MSRAALMAALVLLALTAPAEARRHHHRHHAAAHAYSDTGRPAQCPPRRWCGCWLMQKLGLVDRALWAVTSWRRWGSATTCRPGAIVILRPSHVGQVVACNGDGSVNVLSGNHGPRRIVGTGVYPKRRVVGFRA